MHDQHIRDAPGLLLALKEMNIFVEVFQARCGGEALHGEREGGGKRLLLICDPAGNALVGSAIQSELHAEGGDEQERQHQEQPDAKAIEQIERRHCDVSAPLPRRALSRKPSTRRLSAVKVNCCPRRIQML